MIYASLENFNILRHFNTGMFEEDGNKTFQPIFIDFDIGRAAGFAWEIFQNRTPIGKAPVWET